MIGIVGRLDRFKGHDVLLEAVATVRRDVPDVVLLCVGDGALREQLHADAFRLGLKGHVVWAGRMSQADVYRHVLSMDVVAMPSRPGLEGFGLAAAEAMALGKPVVVSDVDGLSEVAGRDGAALLVPPEDPGALAAALRHLLASPDERHAVGQAARHRVERLFSPGVFADRHVSLYRSLCGNPRSPILNETPECFSRCS